MNKKLLLTLTLTFLGLFSFGVLNASAVTYGTYGDLEYKILDGEVTITGCKETATEVTIPGTIDGYPVTKIGYFAFEYCGSLTRIEVNEDNYSYSSIDGVLFDKEQKTLVIYPSGKRKKTYLIPDSVTSIGDWAFFCCRLTSITIPNSVTSIGEGAFSDCYSLANISIPDGITNIGDQAFYFSRYYNNTSNWENDVLYIGNHLIEAKTTISGIYEVKDGTKTIADYAFYWCDSLTNITIPKGVTSIGSSAFNDCSSLTSISIPDGVTSIGSSTFYDCSSLTSISIPDSVTSIGSSAFNDCSSLTSITIPDSVTNIGDYVFSSSSNLTGITIPDGVTSIGDGTFSECSSLTSIAIPDSVTSIGYSAFSSCRNLTNIAIPKGVTSIGYYAFSDCSSLTGITIPDSVISIDSWAFRDCSGLRNVSIPDSVNLIGGEVFNGCTGLTNIIVDNNNLYYSSDEFGVLYDKGKTNLIQYPAGNQRTSFDIPDSVTRIVGGAFQYCQNLESITISDGVTDIDTSAFSGYTSLSRITVNGSNLYYSSDDFGVLYNKEKTNLLQYPTGNKRTSFDVPNSVTSIGEWAFCDCSSLTGITIPDSVTSIGGYAFYGCHKLSTVYYRGTEEEWKNIIIGDMNDYLTTANIIFLSNTRTTISADGKSFTVKPVNVEVGKTVILALYNGNELLEAQTAVYNGGDIPFTTDKTYTTVKVMVWDSLESGSPVCEPERI